MTVRKSGMPVTEENGAFFALKGQIFQVPSSQENNKQPLKSDWEIQDSLSNTELCMQCGCNHLELSCWSNVLFHQLYINCCKISTCEYAYFVSVYNIWKKKMYL